MILKSIIYWLLSILVLALCLTYPNPAANHKPADPIRLTSFLDVEPSFFYYVNNRFHANVIGQLRLDIKTDRISQELTQYNALVVDDYQYKQNIEFSLNWQVNDQTHQLVFNQTPLSINPIDFHTTDASEITDLHLLITSTQDLGLHNNFRDEITFKAIRLDQLQNQNQLATNLSQWNNFVALKLSSINGYTSSTELPFKQLMLRLSCWLVVTVLMFWLIKIKGLHLIIALLLSWVISSYFYFINHINQHSQIMQAFDAGKQIINRTDLETQDLSVQIAAQINANFSHYSSADKLVLIGNNSFVELRLIHHLQQFNIGLNSNLKTLLESPDGANFTYILIGKELRFCQQTSNFDWLKNHVEVIHIDDKFCLLRKK